MQVDIWDLINILIFAVFGSMVATVLMTLTGLTISTWRESRFARFYYGIPSLLIIISVVLSINENIKGFPNGPELFSYLGAYIGFFGVMIFFVLSWNKNIDVDKYLVRHTKTTEELSSLMKKLHSLIHKLMLITGWIAMGLYIVNRIFLDNGNSYIMRLGLIFFGVCFTLLIVRRLLLIK